MKTQRKEPIIEIVLCRNKLMKKLYNFHFEMLEKESIIMLDCVLLMS